LVVLLFFSLFYLFVCDMSTEPELVEKAREFVKFSTDESAWTLSGDKDGVLISTRVIEGTPLKVARGVTTIKAPIPLILERLQDAELRPKWDRLIKETTMLKKVDDNHAFYYFQSKDPGFFISCRDFVIEIKIVADPDKPNMVTILGSSPSKEEEKELKDEQSGFVRATATNSGYILESVEGEENVTKVYYVIQLDLAGSLPTRVVNMALSDEPHCLHNFRTVCEEAFAASQKADEGEKAPEGEK